jgi:hypothetical protein
MELEWRLKNYYIRAGPALHKATQDKKAGRLMLFGSYIISSQAYLIDKGKIYEKQSRFVD